MMRKALGKQGILLLASALLVIATTVGVLVFQTGFFTGGKEGFYTFENQSVRPQLRDRCELLHRQYCAEGEENKPEEVTWKGKDYKCAKLGYDPKEEPCP